MVLNLIAGSGYYIGLGIEAAVALVAGVLLVLLLANVFVKDDEEEAASEPETRALVVVDDQSAPAAEKKAEEGEVVEAIPLVVEHEEGKGQQQQAQQQPIIINVYNNGSQTTVAQEGAGEGGQEEAKAEEEQAEDAKPEKDSEVKFAEVKTISELYEELTEEQRKYFDELKKKALTKPKAVLSVTKNYESVKVGKHSILKVSIRKGVTIAEFLLESDALKEYKKNSENKKGKSKIRIRPTVIAVTDMDSFKTALDMIDLAHEQLFDD